MSTLNDVLNHVDADLDNALERLFALLRIRSISTDSAYAKECRACADWVVKDLASIGFDGSARETGGHPAVVAHSGGAAARTALFYGHYDVQPVDPLNLWENDPFSPRIVTGQDGAKRIVGRGAADDKGQIMTFIEACRAWKAVTGKLPMGITMLIEGEEEMGSKHLPAFIKANAKELKADMALVCDTGMWDADTPAITTSLRGLVYQEIIITAADRDLHSGMFGGAAANPIHVLSRVIAALHDKDGRVTVPGFYEGVEELPADIKADYDALGLTAKEFLGPIGLSIPSGEKGRSVLELTTSRPTCDVNGIIGGYTGEGTKTVIASQASCKVSFRLVGKQDPKKIGAAFQAFVRSLIPADCKVEFIDYKGSPAFSLPWDMPDMALARQALSDEWGRKTVLCGSGGSIPVGNDFHDTLGLNALFIGFGLEDDRVHSPNEKYDLKSFHKGIRSWVRVLDALAR